MTDPVPGPAPAPAPASGARGAGPIRQRLTLIFGLWVLWSLLWGSVSPVVLLCGAIVAVGAALLCPVPVRRKVTLHPVRLLALAWRTAVQLIGSGATVAWAAVRMGPATKSAVLAVPLQMDTDRLIRGAVQLTGLTPGSLVLEIDREQRVLYVHTMPVRDEADAARRRAEVLASETAILRAFGTDPNGNGNGNGATGNTPGRDRT